MYLSLDAALGSVERIKIAQEPYQRARVARSFLASSLRSAAPFSGIQEDGFVAVDSTHRGLPRDELTFVAVTPEGASAARMQLHLFVGDSGGTPSLQLQVRPISPGDSVPPWKSYTLSTGVAGLEIDYLAAPTGDALSDQANWLERWDSRIRFPNAVRISFIPGEAADPAYRIPLLIQIPAGRIL